MKEKYWNLHQVLEWISYRDLALVEACGGGCLDAVGYPFTFVLRSKRGNEASQTEEEIFASRRTIAQDAAAELEERLEKGPLYISAIREDDELQKREKIFPRNLRIITEALYTYLVQNNPNKTDTRWMAPLFLKAEIVKNWPAKPISKKAPRPSKGELDKALVDIIEKCRKEGTRINRNELYRELNARKCPYEARNRFNPLPSRRTAESPRF